MQQKNISLQTQPTMEDLVKHVGNSLKIPELGATLKGTIIYITKNKVFLDIENLGLGIVRGRELYNEEYLSGLKVGETVEAMVIDLDNEEGLLELSFREIGKDKIWSKIKEAYENGETIDARIRDANRGGLLVKVYGIDGFLPASLLAPSHMVKQQQGQNSMTNQMKEYVGQIFKVKIMSLNMDEENMVVSQKAVNDEIIQNKISKYEVGQLVEGEIVGIPPFGLFIKLEDDLEGLVHISEIAWKKVESTESFGYKIGDKLTLKVVGINESENKINLSIKQTEANPWSKFSKDNAPGDKFTGKVIKIAPYGVIVLNDQDNIQGLCHISQISSQPISPDQIYKHLKIGEIKEFTILGITDDNQKLYLTLLEIDEAREIEKTKSNK